MGIALARCWLDVMDVDERELLLTLRVLAVAARKVDHLDPTTSLFVWLGSLQLKPNMKIYEALVYHILYRALPVENKIDSCFLAYLVGLFFNYLDGIPDERTLLSWFQPPEHMPENQAYNDGTAVSFPSKISK